MKNNYFLLLFLFFAAAFMRGQDLEPMDSPWVTNGTIRAMAKEGATLYLGGSFTVIGPNAPYGTALNTTTGTPDLAFAKPNGDIFAVLPDGQGGWYIGGNFYNVAGQTRNRLARINSDGTLHPWNPNANGTVRTFALVGNTVYAGGDFTTIGGQTRNYIAALDATTGLANAWNPGANNTILALSVSGTTVYAGGLFTTIGGEGRNRIAAIDTTTGITNAWNPNADNTVSTLSVNGTTVYAGGGFTNIGGQTRNRIAAIDGTTGLATAWNPNAGGSVSTLAVIGTTVYAGGLFTTIGGQTRNRIAALDATTGLANAWNPDANNTVLTLAVSGTKVYAGGLFTTIGGQTRNNIAAIDTTTGNTTPWTAHAGAAVNSLAVNGTTLYAGGSFTTIGGQIRNNIGAIDTTTGLPTAWNPGTNNTVQCLKVSGSIIYVGGSFTIIGGQNRNRIAAINTTTGIPTAWDPNATDRTVSTIVISGNTIYVGGTFSNIGGQTRSGLAILDATTGLATDWDPQVTTDGSSGGEIYAILVSGSTIYIGGFFSYIGGEPRNYIGSVDATTGLVTDWNPSANSTVYCFALSGDLLYVGGNFSVIGGQGRNRLAVFDTTTGYPTEWNPNVAGGFVFKFALVDTTLYTIGGFTSVGAQSRGRVAAFNTTTGLVTAWNPALNNTAYSLVVNEGRVYIAGIFTTINGKNRANFAVFANACAFSVTTSKTNNTCNGNSNGTATAIPSDAGTYTYSWNTTPVQTSATATGLAAGTYTVSVADANSCTVTATVTITQPTVVSGTTMVTNIICNGGNTGAINLTPTGGQGPYTYNWDDGITTEDRTGLTAGNYSVTITDVNGCTGTVSLTLTQSTIINVTPASQTNVACFGGSNGAASVNAATGGAGFLTYNWTPGNPTGDGTTSVTGLTAGTWTCTVSDMPGCTNSYSFTITEPSVITGLAASSQTNVSCNSGSNGAASVNPATGGTGTITYDWTPGTPSGDGTTSVTGLAAGTYTVTATDDNGCTKSSVFTITEPSAITGLAANSQTNVSCNSGSNGAASVNPATGGTGTITYDWTPGNPSGDGTTSVTGLAAGIYTVTATDDNGCTKSSVFTITEPATALSGSATATNVSCYAGFNGTINLTPSGGTTPYTYLWNNGVSTTEDRTALSPGTYSVTITDFKGCTYLVDNIVITQPTILAASATKTNVSCNGGTNGTATLTASGGTPSYTYLWSNGANTATASGLGAGTYSVTVTDANSCTRTINNIVITQPTVLEATATQTNVSCNGGTNGTATVAATGGEGTYTYEWLPSGGSAATATGLAVGTYSVKVTDANSCTYTVNNIVITQPTVLAATATQTNILCNGASTGSATVAVTGGTGTYTYAWNTVPVQTTATATGLSAGTYNVTATDGNGCTVSHTLTITQSNLLTLSVNKGNVYCNGGSNGQIQVNVSGGIAPYTYTYSSAITNPYISPTTGNSGYIFYYGLSQGTYTIGITDANGCSKSATFTITEPLPFTVTPSQTNVSCFGGANGSATVAVSGSNTGYQYSWYPSGGNAATATGLEAGTYTVSIMDNYYCTTSQSFTITEPAQLTTIGTQTNLLCNNGSNGSATVAVSGGTGTYTYAWDTTPLQTTATATGLAAGTYNVIATDANGCTVTHTFTITQPTPLSTSGSQANVLCNGQSNGSATINVTGGTGTYTYLWLNTGATTSSVSGLEAGTYSVRVRDANLCEAFQSFTITEPTVLTVTSTQTDISCFNGSNGTINITPSGGTGPYSFLWNNNVTTTEDRTGLAAGTYSVIITDANGCSATVSATVAQPSPIVITSSQTDILCNGSATGSASVTVSGGTGAYTYLWSPSGGTDATASGLTAGTYTVTISDANTCQSSRTFTIAEPSALVASQGPFVEVSCHGEATGAATVNVTGGTGIYTYSWSPSGGTAATATGLAAGTYMVTVKDSNLCETTESFTITQPADILSATTSQYDVSCFGGANGAAILNVSGGTPTYTYLWAPLGGTSPSISGRPAGNYTCTITDSKGCTLVKNITITQPTVFAATTTQVDVSCNGGTNGTATITASGGIAPYSYSWSPSGETGATASGLAAGTYTVIISDSNYCQIVKFVTITQPAILTATTTQVNVSCNGGTNASATVTPTGGTGTYTYLWSNGVTDATASGLAQGTYTVRVSDANNCQVTQTVNITQPTVLTATTTQVDVSCNGGSNATATVQVTGGTGTYTYLWSNGATAATASGLAAGTYTVTATDANTCHVTQTVTIIQPAVLTATTASTSVSCFAGSNGTASVNVSGGTPGYTYLWAPLGGTNASISGRPAGNYTCTITDSKGCTLVKNITISTPAAFSATITKTDVSCNGGTNGSATITASGATAPYSYSWSPSGGTGATASGLAAGTYTVTVNDANTCMYTISVTITQPTILAATTTQVNVLCNGGTGSATVIPTGGTTGYTYSWNTTPAQNTATATGLVAGTYTVLVTDANGCSITKVVTITQPTVLAATTTQVNVTCNGGTNASAIVTATGGTGTYTYVWSPSGGTAATASGLSAGTYNVLVTDANGCSVTKSVTITQPTILAATTTQVNVSCNGGTNASATVTATGGTGTYTYVWSPSGGTAPTASGLSAGTYTVLVTDANGCSITKVVTITQPTILAATTTQVNVSCNGGTNASATVTATGGTGTYTYVWSPSGGTAATASDLSAGTYNLLVTDANGCSVTKSVTITQPTILAATTTQVNVSCNGGTNASATVTATGGTGTYTYVWSPSGGTAATASGLSAGTYNVLVTDANGCSVTKSVTITQPTILAATTTQVNVSCNGGTNASATVTATGGTGTYTYVWSPSGETAATASGLSAGTYNVLVTDANGCSVSEEVTISQPEVLSSVTSYTDALCNGAANGSAEITVSGGTAPYAYLWSDGATTASTSELIAGTYSVTVTDANGCSITEEVVITEPLAIAVDIQPADISTITGNTAQFIAMTTNADSYQWFVSEDGNDWTAIIDGGTQPVYSGTATNILTLNNVPASFNGYFYRLLLTNGTDCLTFTDVALLNINNVLEAANDDFSTNPILEGTEGIAGDVTANDLFNSLPVNDSDILITVVDNGGINGVTIDADGNITLPATGTAGIYTITYQICDITSANNCTTAEAIVVIAPVTGIRQVKDIQFTLYPNPASTLVFIKLSYFAAGSNLKATLYDLNGRLVRENNVSSETFSIDVSRLESAVYILNITSDTAKATKRIVVDKKP